MADEMVTMFEQQETARSAVGHAQDSIMRTTVAFVTSDDGSLDAGTRADLRERVLALADRSAELERTLLAITRDADVEDDRRAREDEKRWRAAGSYQSVWAATSRSPPDSVDRQLFERLKHLAEEATRATQEADAIVADLPRKAPLVAMASRRFFRSCRRSTTRGPRLSQRRA